mgnify:CR=1 FL=1
MDKKTRSNRLRKIETVYNKYKDLFEEKPKEKHQHKSNKTKKPLNNYQKFVKSESKKEIYKNMNVEDRFSTIGKAWKNKKK